MKNLFLTLTLISLATFFYITPSLAQTSSDEFVQKYNITFPVAELGNCTDVASCRSYCEDPLNRTACKTYAETKGIQNPVQQRKEEILKTAQSELGCESEIACKALCSSPENFEKCSSFAKKNSLNGGYKVDKTAIAGQVIQYLGEKGLSCTSYESCKELCAAEENKEICSQLAQKFELRGGTERKGPGGCTSAETCKQYCSDPTNFQDCSQYSRKAAGDNPRVQFTGPGGCTTEQACKLYCLDHPTECKKVTENIKPDINNDGVIDNSDLESLQKPCQSLAQQATTNESIRKEYARYCGELPTLIQDHTQLCQLPQSERPDYMQNEENYNKFCREKQRDTTGTPKVSPRFQDDLKNENNQENAFGPTRKPLNPLELRERRLSPFPTIRRFEPTRFPTRFPIITRPATETDRPVEIKVSPPPIKIEPTKMPETNSGSSNFNPSPTIRIDNSGPGSGGDDADDIKGVSVQHTFIESFFDWLLVRN